MERLIEDISGLIDEAGAMFSTLEPDIAQAIIAMVVSIAFVGLPIIILLLMFLRSVALKFKRDLEESKKRTIREVNKAYANSLPKKTFSDDDTDTQPLFVIQEEPIYQKPPMIAKVVEKTYKIIEEPEPEIVEEPEPELTPVIKIDDFRVSPDKIRLVK